MAYLPLKKIFSSKKNVIVKTCPLNKNLNKCVHTVPDLQFQSSGHFPITPLCNNSHYRSVVFTLGQQFSESGNSIPKNPSKCACNYNSAPKVSARLVPRHDHVLEEIRSIVILFMDRLTRTPPVSKQIVTRHLIFFVFRPKSSSNNEAHKCIM